MAFTIAPLIRMTVHRLAAEGRWQVHAILSAPWAHDNDWSLLLRMASLADQRFSYNVVTVVCYRIANVFGMKLYFIALQRVVHSVSMYTIQTLCSAPFLLIAWCCVQHHFFLWVILTLSLSLSPPLHLTYIRQGGSNIHTPGVCEDFKAIKSVNQRNKHTPVPQPSHLSGPFSTRCA